MLEPRYIGARRKAREPRALPGSWLLEVVLVCAAACAMVVLLFVWWGRL
jgi:hypothetical protein